jgi:uncharacterized protein YaaN involved in tellurite resistance
MLLNMEQKKGAELSSDHRSTRPTNEAITTNAKPCSAQNTTAIHTSLTRSNIAMDALQQNFDSITKSLDEVKRIHADMKQRLITEAPQLEKLSQDLTNRLAQRA